MSRPFHVISEEDTPQEQKPRKGQSRRRAESTAPRPTSKLLINEPPLQVLPSLAVEIGLNEAIVLQQLHYLLLISTNWIEDEAGCEYLWVYNSYPDWQRNYFPFWEEKTVIRAFISLEAKGLVVSEQLDSQNWNQRKYYRIDYEMLKQLELPVSSEL